jgi:hypothetical protein
VNEVDIPIEPRLPDSISSSEYRHMTEELEFLRGQVRDLRAIERRLVFENRELRRHIERAQIAEPEGQEQ